MPSMLLLGLSLCSMFTRVFLTEASAVRLNQTEQATQTIVVQSKLDLGIIESRLTNLESELKSELKSGMSTLESDVKSQISKLESLITKFVGNGGNGSQLLGGNNETSDNIDNAAVYTKHFFVIKEKKDWLEALRSCQASGGELVKVNSNAEQQSLVEFLKKTMPEAEDFWIYSKKGINRKKTDCFVILPFRDPVIVGTQTCSNWKVANSAVCEKFVENGGNDNDNDDDDVDVKKKPINRFFVIAERKNWREARKSCQALGGDLATLTSYAEQYGLMKSLKKKFKPNVADTFWLGSKKGRTSGEGPGNWKWINEDRTTNPDDESFTWLSGKNLQGAGCLRIHVRSPPGFDWTSCNTYASYAVCEKKN